MISSLEKNLLDALVELENVAKSTPGSNPKPSLLPLFDHIDQLAAQLPHGADAELRHFLQRKSYAKARLLLEGRRSDE
jgi:hypothetical protein